MEICDKCGEPVEIGSWPFCPHPLTGWRARIGDLPVVVYEDGRGNVQFPGSATEPMPKRLQDLGYQRKEMTFHEARRFQKQFNSAERERESIKLEIQQQIAAEQYRESREELRQQMQHFSERGKDFARFVMEQNNREDAGKYYSHDPGFYIEALE